MSEVGSRQADADLTYLQGKVAKADADDKGRQRWGSRTSFILAAIGSAIGLGNLWRFPYLSYEYGGGVFFIPYFICLVAIGIPMLLLELTIGQTFQRGDVGAFGGFHPRAQGIGFVSIFCGYMITCYYNVIIAWALCYFVMSFFHPLWWAPSENYTVETGVTDCDSCSCQGTGSAAVDTFLKTVGEFTWKDCEAVDYTDSQFVVWKNWGAVIFVWITIFLCIFKGVKLTSKIVWFTVLAPVFLLFVLFWAAVTLDGAGKGIKAYIGEWEWDDLSMGVMWNAAAGQIFFTLSVCMGVMTSYGSYNQSAKPVTRDNFIIALSNTGFSIFAGFVVFSVLGYEAHRQGVEVDELSGLGGMGLSFMTMPTALVKLRGAQFWCIIFFGTLVTLGVDSAFSLLEAVTTVISDTKLGERFSRQAIAGALTFVGCFISMMYCTDVGLALLDVADHYINGYTMQLVGLLQCVAAAWVYGFSKAADRVGLASARWYVGTFWAAVCVWAALAVGLVEAIDVERPDGVGGEAAIGWVCGMFVLCLGWTRSYQLSNCTPSEWFDALFLYGASSMAKHMSLLDAGLKVTDREGVRMGHGTKGVRQCWYWVFSIWWQLSIKYIIPVALLFLTLFVFHDDIDSRYMGYPMGYHAFGFGLVGATLFLGGIFMLPFVSILKAEDEIEAREYIVEGMGKGKGGGVMVHDEESKIQAT